MGIINAFGAKNKPLANCIENEGIANVAWKIAYLGYVTERFEENSIMSPLERRNLVWQGQEYDIVTYMVLFWNLDIFNSNINLTIYMTFNSGRQCTPKCCFANSPIH